MIQSSAVDNACILLQRRPVARVSRKTVVLVQSANDANFQGSYGFPLNDSSTTARFHDGCGVVIRGGPASLVKPLITSDTDRRVVTYNPTQVQYSVN